MSAFTELVKANWPQQASTIIGLIRGKINPTGEQFPKTVEWIRKCYNRPSSYELILSAINEAIGGYGVEGVDPDQEADHAWEMHLENGGDPNDNPDMIERPIDDWISYVNLGDTYATTIVYDHDSGLFHVDSWGGFLEDYRQSCQGCDGEGHTSGIGNREITCDQCGGSGGRRESTGEQWERHVEDESDESW